MKRKSIGARIGLAFAAVVIVTVIWWTTAHIVRSNVAGFSDFWSLVAAVLFGLTWLAATGYLIYRWSIK